jgi:predicted RND superfamily exporter protein
VRLGVTGLNKKDVPENDRKVAEKKIEELKSSTPNLVAGAYLDLTLEVKEDSDWEKISNTKGPVKIVVDVPSDIQKKAGKCFMMRIHEDVATILEDTDDDPKTLTVESDEFSTYVMLYEKKESKQEKEETVSTVPADKEDNKSEVTKTEEKSPDTGTASITEHSSETSGQDSEMWRIVLFVVLVVVVVGVIILGVYGSKLMNKE